MECRTPRQAPGRSFLAPAAQSATVEAMAEEGQDKGKGKAPAPDPDGDKTAKQEETAKEEKELKEERTPKPLELIPRPEKNPYGTRGEKLTLVANFFDVNYSAPKNHILLYDVSGIGL